MVEMEKAGEEALAKRALQSRGVQCRSPYPMALALPSLTWEPWYHPLPRKYEDSMPWR